MGGLPLLSVMGNTPTSVGKTYEDKPTEYEQEKHPHERGEDLEYKAFQDENEETPPRAWGRPIVTVISLRVYRNTPTSVGKTP